MANQTMLGAMGVAAMAAEEVPKTRPLYEIMSEVKREWKKPYFGAVPYIQALSECSSPDDVYLREDARGLINYFLANATSWRGDVAKRIKAELKAMVGRK